MFKTLYSPTKTTHNGPQRDSERTVRVIWGESGREKTQPNQGNQTPTHIGSDELERGTGGLEIDWEGFGERRGRMGGGSLIFLKFIS